MNNDPNILKAVQVPTRNINGERLPETVRLRDLVGKLVISPLSQTQQKVYDILKPAYLEDEIFSLNSADIDDIEDNADIEDMSFEGNTNKTGEKIEEIENTQSSEMSVVSSQKQ